MRKFKHWIIALFSISSLIFSTPICDTSILCIFLKSIQTYKFYLWIIPPTLYCFFVLHISFIRIRYNKLHGLSLTDIHYYGVLFYSLPETTVVQITWRKCASLLTQLYYFSEISWLLAISFVDVTITNVCRF